MKYWSLTVCHYFCGIHTAMLRQLDSFAVLDGCFSIKLLLVFPRHSGIQVNFSGLLGIPVLPPRSTVTSQWLF